MKGKKWVAKRWWFALAFALGAVLGLNLFSQYVNRHPDSWAGRTAFRVYRALHPVEASVRILLQNPPKAAAPDQDPPAVVVPVDPPVVVQRPLPNQGEQPRAVNPAPHMVNVVEPTLVEPIVVEALPVDALTRPTHDRGGEEEASTPVQRVARRMANQAQAYMPYADEPKPAVETPSETFFGTCLKVFARPIAILAERKAAQGTAEEVVDEECEEPMTEQLVPPTPDHYHPPHCPYSGRCLPSHYRYHEIPTSQPRMPMAQETAPVPEAIEEDE